MNIQYITDSDGVTTGVYIPIDEWKKFKESSELIDNSEIPEWHKKILDKRSDLSKIERFYSEEEVMKMLD